jgi:SNF2 family DNA or RNA helicase
LLAPSGEALAREDEGRSAWFDLSLGMSIDGQRQNILPLLPELLAQLAAVTHSSAAGTAGGERGSTLQLPDYVYIHQPDGRYVRLPCAPLRPWLQALLDLLGERGHSRTADLKGEVLRLSRMEALRMGGALSEGVAWQGEVQLRRMVDLLGGRAELPPVAPPEGLQATLRPYQLHGLQWLQFLRANRLAGILADDMGLGKTLQTLAHILLEKQAGRLDLPALIIAPVSLMGNWRQEAARFTPQLRTLVLHGANRHEAAADIARHDIVVAPYSLLLRDRERWQAQAWHLVVLDEAQNIKNANSHAAQVAGELDTRHRLCLSGTPMENHLGELWSLFNFLMPGFLGSQARFKSLYRTPIEKRGDGERAAQLRRRIAPFMLRRHKSEVATDLPEKQITVSSVELGSAQADLYETIRLTTEKSVRDALASKGLATAHIQILDALLKLRQVCCDPRLVSIPAAQKVTASAKLELLMELLPELLAEGRKVLLFSQFTSMLELIEGELAKRGIRWAKLTGQSQKRDQIIERFTSGAVPLFLISLKAGGVGLNLVEADTVIHYDPWWNPAAEMQATDRAHRIGQTQRVMVYKLVAQGTIEERILALQERKAALADSLYTDAGERTGGLFTESDLENLLRPLGDERS